jgi:hypothetical protein
VGHAARQEAQALQPLPLGELRLQVHAGALALLEHEPGDRHRREVGQVHQERQHVLIDGDRTLVAEGAAPQDPQRPIDDADRHVHDGAVVQPGRDVGVARDQARVGNDDRSLLAAERRDQPVTGDGGDRKLLADRLGLRARDGDESGLLVLLAREDVEPRVRETEPAVQLVAHQRHQGVVVVYPAELAGEAPEPANVERGRHR